MATYNFSTFSTGTVFTSADILNFDDSTDAASVVLTVNSASLDVKVGNTTKTLKNFSLTSITSSNFVFSNGTKMIIGDGTTATTADDAANTLTGGDYNDYLDGRASGSSGTDAYSADTVSYATAPMAVTINLSYNTSSSIDATYYTDPATASVNTNFGKTLSAPLGSLSAPSTQLTIGAGNDTIVRIENVIGSVYNDLLVGTNYVAGVASGNNTLDGGLGIDTMAGGTGADSYFLTPGDIVVETTTTANDAASSTLTYKNSDILVGQAKADISVPTASGGGYLGDTVYTTFSYTLPANVENLVLQAGDINGIGNTLNNFILGSTGANLLDGGTGNDTLKGGAGNDIYVINSGANNGDKVFESAAAGTDTIWTAANWTQGAVAYTMPDNVENLRMLGTANTNITGNASDNIIYVNTGVNTVNGGSGTDTISFQYGATSGVTFTFVVAGGTPTAATGGSSADVISGMEIVIGSNYSDNLTSALDTRNNTLAGGAGNDNYLIEGTQDYVIESAGQGLDTITSISSADLSQANLVNVENLILTGATNSGVIATGTATDGLSGTGNALDNYITGNAGNNLLSGLAGNDTIDAGAGTTTTDVLQGGAGNDAYVINSDAAVVTESTGQGTDTVYASEGYNLLTNTNSAGVENLVLTGISATFAFGITAAATAANAAALTTAINGTGNDIANTITGNAGINSLVGGLGADTLYGNGGNDILDGDSSGATTTAADSMVGGDGNDTYIVNNTGDKVIETNTATTSTENGDKVESSVTYTLGANLDDLTLTGTGAINGTGNALSNTMVGNEGKNSLVAGDGADSISAGAGNDTVDGGAANDTINGGADANSLLGGAGNDNIQGGTSTDTINGGTGNDAMTGSGGDDVYYVDVSNYVTGSEGTLTLLASGANALTSSVDNVVEVANGGSDLINASVSYIATNEVEKLTLTGTSSIHAMGNASANTLTGNTGNNILLGLAANDTIVGGTGNDTLNGGLGQDSLTGGTGADVFVFTGLKTTSTDAIPVITITVESAFGSADKITDFVPGTDLIDLSNALHLTSGVPVTFIGNIGGATSTTPLTNNTTAGITVSYYEDTVNSNTIIVANTSTTSAGAVDSGTLVSSDLVITLSGVLTLSEANFIL